MEKLKSGEIQPISDWLIIPLNDDVPVGGGVSAPYDANVRVIAGQSSYHNDTAVNYCRQ